MPLVLHFPRGAIDPDQIEQAAELLAGGAVAIFPTETVYGIGAAIDRPDAVARVFALKRRDPALPLMAHCSGPNQLALVTDRIPEIALRLVQCFWPGPLALVFRRAASLSGVVTGGAPTIGVRMVSHPVTQNLIARLGRPLAGTSANYHAEPDTADFTLLDAELVSTVDLALDAGICGSGRASTVLDCTGEEPRLIRPGAVPVAEIEPVIGHTLAR
ncbi:MAG: L-threonylcarbamoyladenylate synthase [bacterium]